MSQLAWEGIPLLTVAHTDTYMCSPWAHNREKAQSMLFHLREAQATELGLDTCIDRWQTLSRTKYVWYHGHRDHISCVPKTEELFQEHFYRLKAPGVEEEEDCGYHPTHRLL